ncbi:MAG TPA: hypothetical protein DD435_02395 [Cyanobacteria bacterium UBA8530]|nr:hypothetical protein [Cyanobacteria bacterium UBA8530]
MIIKHTPPKPTPVPTPFLDEMPPVLPETPPTPLPTPKPLPTAMVLSTPAPVLATPTPEPTPSPVPQDGALPLSSLHLVWQQLDVQETYPILNADSTFSSNTTFGVLTDYRGLAWKHWVNDFFGFSLEGRLASFKLLDRLSSTSNDRTDTMAHPVVSFRYPLGTILPEASLGFLYRSTLVKPHADIAEDKSKYPSSANLSLMGPTLGAGVRFQIFKPLALLVGGYVTPFTMSSSSYEKEVQTNLSTFKLTPLGDSRMTIQALLDIAPMQFALGGYMEGISGKTTLDVPAYKQTNNGITLGVGFSY